MLAPICARCKELTWPDRWCQCDPREQMADFLRDECVILMSDEIFEEQRREQEEALRAPTPASPPPDELAPRRRRRRARHAH